MAPFPDLPCCSYRPTYRRSRALLVWPPICTTPMQHGPTYRRCCQWTSGQHGFFRHACQQSGELIHGGLQSGSRVLQHLSRARSRRRIQFERWRLPSRTEAVDGFLSGTLVNTGNPTDLALSGAGFFAVNGPAGTLYTRSGNFHFSAQGQLVTPEGYPVRLTGNQILQTQSGSPLQVGADGQILQDGNPLGQLELATFKDSSQLARSAGVYFQNADALTTPGHSFRCPGPIKGKPNLPTRHRLNQQPE